MIEPATHPKLDARGFTVTLPRPLGELTTPDAVIAGLALEPRPTIAAQVPRPDDAVRLAVRDLLRAGGFKPTGRNKPASEYLLAAAATGRLGAINLLVDACNLASLHSGLPISVVDLDRTRGPLQIVVAPAGAAYVFNASGQELDLGGLLVLADADGPCANAVKDSQRTKTHAGTLRALVVVWGTTDLPGRAEAAAELYRAALQGLDVRFGP